MRKIKIRVPGPYLGPTGTSPFTHTNTEYQLSTSPLFETANLVLNAISGKTGGIVNANDDIRLTYALVNIDDTTPKSLYTRVRYHFSKTDAGTTTQHVSSWSKIMPMSVDRRDVAVMTDSVIVKTPEVIAKRNLQEDSLEITVSPFALFAGNTETNLHTSTSYKIVDSDGKIHYERMKDTENLVTLNIEDTLKSGRFYTVESQVSSNTSNSNFGKAILLNYTPNLNLFELQAPEELVFKRKFYYRLRLWLDGYRSHDIEVRTKTGETIFKQTDITSTSNNIFVDQSTPGTDVNIFVRLKLKNGSYTPYKIVYSTILGENRLVNYYPDVTYINKIDLSPDAEGENRLAYINRQLFDGWFIDPYEDGTNPPRIRLIRKENNITTMVKDNVLPGLTYTTMQYCNIMQLPNHDVILDCELRFKDASNNWTTKNVFIKCEYDPIKVELKETGRLYRPLERFATSVSNSMVADIDSNIYYVPAMKYSEDLNIEVELSIIKVNTKTMEVEYEVPLNTKSDYRPTRNVGMIMDAKNNMYVFGGSNKMKLGPNKEEIYTRDYNYIYKFDPITKKLGYDYYFFNSDIPTNVYNMQAFLKIDGHVQFFNACSIGDGLNYQKLMSWTTTYNWDITTSNFTTGIPFRNNIVYNNGNIQRSATDKKAYTFISNTKTVGNVNDNITVSPESRDLVVATGKTVTIEDPYKYNSITIQGTGKLIWSRPQGILEFDSRDMIVCSNKTMAQSAVNCKNLLILDGVTLTINQ